MTITEAAARDGVTVEDLAAHFGLAAGADGLIDHEAWESVYTPGKLVLLAAWRDAAAAKAWAPALPAHHRQVRVIRDYGMSERREAPQYYPDVQQDAAQPAAPVRRAAGQ
jgi:heme-degrading monooxygenase HmoA